MAANLFASVLPLIRCLFIRIQSLLEQCLNLAPVSQESINSSGLMHHGSASMFTVESVSLCLINCLIKPFCHILLQSIYENLHVV